MPCPSGFDFDHELKKTNTVGKQPQLSQSFYSLLQLAALRAVTSKQKAYITFISKKRRRGQQQVGWKMNCIEIWAIQHLTRRKIPHWQEVSARNEFFSSCPGWCQLLWQELVDMEKASLTCHPGKRGSSKTDLPKKKRQATPANYCRIKSEGCGFQISTRL